MSLISVIPAEVVPWSFKVLRVSLEVFSLHGFMWLLVLQPSHLHSTQEEERKKGRSFLIRTFLECCAQYFCLHPIARNHSYTARVRLLHGPKKA